MTPSPDTQATIYTGRKGRTRFIPPTGVDRYRERGIPTVQNLEHLVGSLGLGTGHVVAEVAWDGVCDVFGNAVPSDTSAGLFLGYYDASSPASQDVLKHRLVLLCRHVG